MSHHPITRMVHMLSEAHSAKESVRAGNKSMHELARRTIFSRRHFPKFLAFSMTASGFAGWFYMASVHNRHLQVGFCGLYVCKD